MTEKYNFRKDDQGKPFCGDPIRSEIYMMISQLWKELKEDHFKSPISMIYSVECIPPSSSFVCSIL